ncbi:MAG: hypothetical protein FWH59_04075, partial [Lentimicrobiaceae bacterium]|nr:hypothetical protein [Lentimicrobiaceae bacterium]
MKHFNKFLILLAFLGLSISATLAQSTYIITGNGGTFTATKNGTAVATNTLLQLVIDAVKTNANGADCTIQFENGSNTLNTGDNNITFDGGANGTAWGLITLTGKITSTSVMWSGGTICLKNGVSVNSKADITNPGGGDALAIYHQSTGTLTISEGTVKNTGTTTITIFAVGPLNITGGRVEANGVNANAIVVGAEGKVTISGDAVVTSKNTNAYTPGTIFVGDNADGDCLEINGGTVENTADLGGAIANFSATGTVNISGGTVSATTGVAIWNDDTGKITISETAKVTSKNLPGSSNLTGTIVLKDAGTATDCRLEITGGTVENTVELDFYNDIYGIAICNLSTGAVNISDGDISASIAVYNYSPGAVNISGGEISGDYLAVYGGVGMVNISGGKISASPTDGYMKIAIMIGNGTVNISGGEISANVNTVGDAVYAVANMDGTVNISGGEISASATNAGSIWAVVNGKITTISGGNISTSSTDGYAVINIGTLTISGGTIENTSGYGNTIFNRDATSVIEVSGGTVRSSGGDAIVNNGGKLTIKERGMVIALEGYAVDNSSGTLTISHNSIIFACGKNASEVINGAYTQQNNAVVAAWDNKTNITTYTANTTDDLFTDPAAASALWTKQDGNSGIAVKYGATDGFIPIAGVTVTGAP